MKYDITEALSDLIMAANRMPSIIMTAVLAKTEIRQLRAENESLKALAKLGRWALDQAVSLEKSKFSVEDANAIDAKATELGLGYMEDMGTYEVFLETALAKVLDANV